MGVNVRWKENGTQLTGKGNAGYYCMSCFLLELNRPRIKGAVILGDMVLSILSCHTFQNMHAQLKIK